MIKYKTILNMDCLQGMKQLEDGSIDLIVTDPPYGYSFMGKDWDKAVPSVSIWKECLRVLKPGGFAFIMSSPRQDVQSQMIKRLEKARFNIKFTPIYWTYATGFPKAMNIGKAIDKKFGIKREIISRNPNSREKCNKSNSIYESGTIGKTDFITQGNSKLEGSYAGFQPKPAVEIILVAMKPLECKTYVEQALKNGKGITWLDDCKTNNRFPANLLVSNNILKSHSKFFDLDKWEGYPFINVPKASKSEKNKGCEGIKPEYLDDSRKDKNAIGCNNPRNRTGTIEKNFHPTVKPIKLMSYLVTLGSRSGDIILDPFIGSGTTAIACKVLGRKYIGFELDSNYCKIAEARLEIEVEK